MMRQKRQNQSANSSPEPKGNFTPVENIQEEDFIVGSGDIKNTERKDLLDVPIPSFEDSQVIKPEEDSGHRASDPQEPINFLQTQNLSDVKDETSRVPSLVPIINNPSPLSQHPSSFI
jgi:hypothetical protein